MSADLRLIRSDVQAMHAYVVQDAGSMVKLDAMENPYGLPADLQAQLGERLGRVAINRYPGARINDLRQALAATMDLPPGYGLTLGNGSDELISLLALACAHQGATVSTTFDFDLAATITGGTAYYSATLNGLG